MCAILDVNRAHELLLPVPSEAVGQLREWLVSGRGKLVVGGELLDELRRDAKVREWIADLSRAGRVVLLTPDVRQLIYARSEDLRSRSDCKSDDEHIIALAQITGARLLYTNDKDLQADFTNPRLIGHPRGKLYPVNANRTIRRRLLDRRDICGRNC